MMRIIAHTIFGSLFVGGTIAGTAVAAFAQQAPPWSVPFALSPEEEAVLDRTLAAWEQRSKEVRTFEADIIRWKYDTVFGKDNKPISIDKGILKYAAPDRGLFRVNGDHPEQWVCDGKSIYRYEYEQKQLREYPLPPELQGKAISDGPLQFVFSPFPVVVRPLPFFFTTEAQKLKQRYFLRVVTPRNAQNEIWLEAHPRWRCDCRVDVIFQREGMMPLAIQIHELGGKARTVYGFDNVVINGRSEILDDPFRASVPFGWTKHVEQPPPAQAARPADRVR